MYRSSQLSDSVLSDSATPWTVACQVPLSTGFFQARTLDWVAISFSRGSPLPRNQTQVSGVCCTGRQILCHDATGKIVCIVLYPGSDLVWVFQKSTLGTGFQMQEIHLGGGIAKWGSKTGQRRQPAKVHY